MKENSSFVTNSFLLMQNYPNPFNPTTSIRYSLPTNSYVTLKIYDILGKEICTLVNKYQDAGYHYTLFDAANLPSGVYFYKLQAGMHSDTKKLIILK